MSDLRGCRDTPQRTAALPFLLRPSVKSDHPIEIPLNPSSYAKHQSGRQAATARCVPHDRCKLTSLQPKSGEEDGRALTTQSLIVRLDVVTGIGGLLTRRRRTVVCVGAEGKRRIRPSRAGCRRNPRGPGAALRGCIPRVPIHTVAHAASQPDVVGGRPREHRLLWSADGSTQSGRAYVRVRNDVEIRPAAIEVIQYSAVRRKPSRRAARFTKMNTKKYNRLVVVRVGSVVLPNSPRHFS